MPYKHQSESYRNIGGIRYEQWSDFEEDFPQLIADLKAEGRKYRVVKMSDGARRLFREVKSTDGQRTQ